MSATTPQSSHQLSRNWLELPPELTTTILSKLEPADILKSAQLVCSTWRNIANDPSLWRSIDLRNAGDPYNLDYDVGAMCFHAIDRSCGGLLDINFQYFGTDFLLKHIADRACCLRRLRLLYFHNISNQVMIESVARFPLLEDLELSFFSFPKEVLEAVGRSCPLLKSFKLNCEGYRRPRIECDEDALAIAENMHELRHLQLFGNKLTDDGLHAILDGCPHLEFLDLRQCFNVSFGGDLEKRCAKQIKHLRRPYDPTDDYEFDGGCEFDDESDDDISSEEDYSSGLSYIDLLSDDDYNYEFSGDSDYPDYEYSYSD